MLYITLGDCNKKCIKLTNFTSHSFLMSSVRITWTSPLWKNLKLYMKSSFRVHTNFMTLIKCSVWFVLHYVAPQLARPLLLPTVARSQIHMNSLPHYHRAENSSRVPPMSKAAHQRDTLLQQSGAVLPSAGLCQYCHHIRFYSPRDAGRRRAEDLAVHDDAFSLHSHVLKIVFC